MIRCLLLCWLFGWMSLGAQPPLRFATDFSRAPVGWQAGLGDSLAINWEAGKLSLGHASAVGTGYWVREAYLSPQGAFALEATFTPAPGSLNGRYGLVWSASYDGSRLYRFEVRPEGYFRVVKVSQGREEVLADWNRHRKVKGPGEPNTLRVEKRGWKLYFSINDKELFDLNFPRWKGNYQGVFLQGKQTAQLHRYAIYAPAPELNLVSGSLLKARKLPLDTTLNTPDHHETAPQLHPRRGIIWFSRAPHERGWAADLYRAAVQGDSMWGPPEPVAGFNNSDRNAVAAIGEKGASLWLCSRYGPSGSPLGPGLTHSRLEDSRWLPPVSLRLPGYLPATPATFCFGPDGKTLIFSMDGSADYGDQDLYVSFLQEGKWTAPRNLGPAINSYSLEFAPYLAPDNKTLYFASGGLPGYGGVDLYRSPRLSSTWTQWSKPENLGPRVNGPGWDAFWTPVPGSDGRHIYLASSDSATGDWDLYGLRIPLDVKELPVVRVSGTVRNRKTGEPLGATVHYQQVGQAQGPLQQTDAPPPAARFDFYAPFGEAYQLYAQRPGYFPIVDTLDLRRYSVYRETERDLFLAPIEAGETIQLDRVFFERAQDVLLPGSYAELDRLLNLMQALPTMRIEILGHTDNIGDERELQALSQARAARVRQYLVDRGIAASRIQSKGLGSSQPIASNEDPRTRPRNRRVEFRILRR